LGVSHRGPDHLAQLGFVLWGHQHHPRERPEIADVEQALMGAAVVADDAGAVQGEDHR